MMHITMVDGNSDEIHLLTINAFNFYQSNFEQVLFDCDIYKTERQRMILISGIHVSENYFELFKILVMLVTSL